MDLSMYNVPLHEEHVNIKSEKITFKNEIERKMR